MVGRVPCSWTWLHLGGRDGAREDSTGMLDGGFSLLSTHHILIWQSISLLLYLSGYKRSTGPFLILCPLSVLSNWQLEMARLAGHIRYSVGDIEVGCILVRHS